MLCALIQNNTVVAVEDLTDAQIQAIGNQYQNILDVSGYNPAPSVGAQFDGVSAIIGGTANMKITKLSFSERFTLAEAVAIQNAAATNLTLQVLQQRQALATYIDLGRSDTQSGVEYLVSLGLLTQDRATAILTTPPTAQELYQG